MIDKGTILLQKCHHSELEVLSIPDIDPLVDIWIAASDNMPFKE